MCIVDCSPFFNWTETIDEKKVENQIITLSESFLERKSFFNRELGNKDEYDREGLTLTRTLLENLDILISKSSEIEKEKIKVLKDRLNDVLKASTTDLGLQNDKKLKKKKKRCSSE